MLCRLITVYGLELCDHPAQLRALLRDFCGQYRREVNVLVLALEEQIHHVLLASGAQPQSVLLARLTVRLQDNRGLSQDIARWAVESWAIALGLALADEPSAPSGAQHEVAAIAQPGYQRRPVAGLPGRARRAAATSTCGRLSGGVPATGAAGAHRYVTVFSMLLNGAVSSNLPNHHPGIAPRSCCPSSKGMMYGKS